MRSDIEIAREARLRPIVEIAEILGLGADDLYLYGNHIAKVPLAVMDRYRDAPDGRMILVTAMTPTRFGEGKTTTTIGLTQALWPASARGPCAPCASPHWDPAWG